MTEAQFQTMDDIGRYLDTVESLDQSKVDRLREEWHLTLPQPYEQAVAALDLTDIDVVRSLHEAIVSDEALSDEEKYVLKHEISDRRGMATLATAPEGWND